jgi:hypothetical protein
MTSAEDYLMYIHDATISLAWEAPMRAWLLFFSVIAGLVIAASAARACPENYVKCGEYCCPK